MLNFLKSKEFLGASLILIAAFVLQFAGDLANIIQDCGLYGWAYVIWKQEKNHKHLIGSWREWVKKNKSP